MICELTGEIDAIATVIVFINSVFLCNTTSLENLRTRIQKMQRLRVPRKQWLKSYLTTHHLYLTESLVLIVCCLYRFKQTAKKGKWDLCFDSWFELNSMLAWKKDTSIVNVDLRKDLSDAGQWHHFRKWVFEGRSGLNKIGKERNIK